MKIAIRVMGAILTVTVVPACMPSHALARRERLPDSVIRPEGDDATVRTVLRSGPSDTDAIDRGSQVASNVPADPYARPRSAAPVDPNVRYVALTGEDVAGAPELPPQYDVAYPTHASPASVNSIQDRRPAGETTHVLNGARTRRLAQQIQQTQPEKLNAFMEDVREGAIQGNWDAVLATWEVAMEFESTMTRPSDHHSLSSSIHGGMPPTVDTHVSLRPTAHEEPQSQPVASDSPWQSAAESAYSRDWRDQPRAPADPAPRAPIDELRRLPEPSPKPYSASRRDSAADFASWADEFESRASLGEGPTVKWDVYGRILHAMAGDTESALVPIQGLDPADRRFWRGYVYALDRYFNDNRSARPEQRVTEAAVALRDSVDALAEKADLRVTQPIFCKAVNSFGNYEEFDSYQFRAGEGVVAYWESSNFASVESADGFRTSMQAEFEILDSQGNRRHRFEQKFKDDFCKSRRHDYFNVVVFEWPRELPPGEYKLRLLVTDRTSNRVAETTQSFQIVP